MIVVTHKNNLDYPKPKEWAISELYALINTIYTGGGYFGVCERLSDEWIKPEQQHNKKVQRFKGDFEIIELKWLRVVRHGDDDEERENYLKELKSLLHDTVK